MSHVLNFVHTEVIISDPAVANFTEEVQEHTQLEKQPMMTNENKNPTMR